MENRRMTDEHVIELATARVLREIRDTRRWLIGSVVALIGVLSTIATISLGALTERRVQSEAEGYVADYARESAKSVTRNLDQHTSAPEATDQLVAGDTTYLLEADSTKRLLILPRTDGRGDRRYEIVATGIGGFDPVLSLYRVSEQTRPSLLAFNDDHGVGFDSKIVAVLQDTVEYELRVNEFSGRSGRVRISVKE